VPLGELVGDLADDERPGHVRRARRLVVARPDVDQDRLTGLQDTVAQVVADRGLWSVGDDEVVAARAMLDEDLPDRRLHTRDGQRLPVELQAVAVHARRREHRPRRAHRPLRGQLRPPNAGQLPLRLGAPPGVEELPVGGQLDTLGTQPVREQDREARRHDRASDSERMHRAHRQLVEELAGREPALPELVEPEVLERVQLEFAEALEQRNLHRVDHHVPRAAAFDVEERVDDCVRHLVTQLGRADGVGEDDDVAHRRRTLTPLPPTATARGHGGLAFPG
jgi:hypothetical protein